MTGLFLFLAPKIAAQEKVCPVDLPVGLIDNKGTLLEGLTPQDLTIRQSKQNLAIQSVKYDSAPGPGLIAPGYQRPATR